MQIDIMVDDLYEARDLDAYQGRHEEYENIARDYPGRKDNTIATTQDNHRRYDIMEKIFIDNY